MASLPLIKPRCTLPPNKVETPKNIYSRKLKHKEKTMNGILGLLTVLFVGLKLTGYIAWSWWLVLAPLWGGLAFFLIMTVIGLIAVAGAGIILNKQLNNKRPSYLR